ncbi:MAG: site-specific integrase [Terracidiphilus sp.]|nr:site-specific integrase [Terracidiphilus sp.]
MFHRQLSPAVRISPDLLFSIAFDVWMLHRTIRTQGIAGTVSYLSENTDKDYRTAAKSLSKFFSKFRLDQINAGHLMDYQRARATNPSNSEGVWRCLRGSTVQGEFGTREAAEGWAKSKGGDWHFAQTLWTRAAGANCIRKEIGLLIRILRSARLWGDDERDNFLPLRPVENDLVRAMTPEEQHRFLQVAGSREEWRLIYQYTIIALQTTASTNELRALRLGNILLGADSIVQIPRPGAKNKYRMRSIPIMTDDAVWAFQGLIGRARELGSVAPSHYLFPIQSSRGKYDPSRPISNSGLKKPWDAVRKAAGMPQLRIYDLRHTGITRMAEAGVPIRVIMNFAGHMTAKMQQHYEAISMSSKRDWGQQVWGARTPQPISAPRQQDWRQEAAAAGWSPNTPQPSPEVPAWQKRAMAEGWIAPQ